MQAVEALILAWFLNLFGFGDIFINGSKEIFGLTISISGYYFIFFLVGLLVDIIQFFKRGDNNGGGSNSQETESSSDEISEGEDN